MSRAEAFATPDSGLPPPREGIGIAPLPNWFLGSPRVLLLFRAGLLAPGLKLLKRLLHDRKGDANLQGLRVTDALDLQFLRTPWVGLSQSSLVLALIGTSAMLTRSLMAPLLR